MYCAKHNKQLCTVENYSNQQCAVKKIKINDQVIKILSFSTYLAISDK